jgi:1-acyl-sn-glycerol-3-phosphate acyltransferase
VKETKEHIPVVYRISRLFFLFWLVILFRFKSYGAYNIPSNGGCIIAANHASYLDPLVVGCGISKRYIRFIARTGLFNNKFAKWWIKQIKLILIKRGTADLTAIKKTVNGLKQGNLVCVFPEGTRTVNGHLQEAKKGIGFLIQQADVPVVPAYISGSYQILPKGSKFPKLKRLTITYGEPILPEQFSAACVDKKDYQAQMKFLMKKIEELSKRK